MDLAIKVHHGPTININAGNSGILSGHNGYGVPKGDRDYNSPKKVKDESVSWSMVPITLFMV